jgi:hypothetical protein
MRSILCFLSKHRLRGAKRLSLDIELFKCAVCQKVIAVDVKTGEEKKGGKYTYIYKRLV